MATLTNILDSIPLSGQLKQFRNQEIEVDIDVLRLDFAVSFDNCRFSFSNNICATSLTIFTNQGVRFENCTLAISICIWGEAGGAEYAVLDKKGPNVFFDKCEWQSHDFRVFDQAGHRTTPQLQVSGFITHFRSEPTTSSEKSKLSISQCRFDKCEIIGTFSMLQLVEYTGNELILKNVSLDFIWIRESLLHYIKYIDIDMATTNSICNSFTNRHSATLHDVDVIKNFMNVFSNKKEGGKFLKMNDVYCKKAESPTLAGTIALGFFKNFYAVKPFLILFALIIIIFAFIYFPFVVSYDSAILNSLYAFSGNPQISNESSFIFSLLKATEAFLGVFAVIITSLVIGRKYSYYV